MVNKIKDQNTKFFSNADLAKLFFPIVVEQFLEYSLGLANSLMAQVLVKAL